MTSSSAVGELIEVEFSWFDFVKRFENDPGALSNSFFASVVPCLMAASRALSPLITSLTTFEATSTAAGPKVVRSGEARRFKKENMVPAIPRPL